MKIPAILDRMWFREFRGTSSVPRMSTLIEAYDLYQAQSTSGRWWVDEGLTFGIALGESFREAISLISRYSTRLRAARCSNCTNIRRVFTTLMEGNFLPEIRLPFASLEKRHSAGTAFVYGKENIKGQPRWIEKSIKISSQHCWCKLHKYIGKTNLKHAQEFPCRSDDSWHLQCPDIPKAVY